MQTSQPEVRQYASDDGYVIPAAVAFNRDLCLGARLMYGAIRRAAGAPIAVLELAAEVGCGERTATTYIAKLIAAGMISRVRRDRSRTRLGPGIHVYSLHAENATGKTA